MSDPLTVDQQLREWLNQLSAEHKLILFDILCEDARMLKSVRHEHALHELRKLTSERKLNWDKMTEPERESFLDTLIKENELYSTQIGQSQFTRISDCKLCGRGISPTDLYKQYFGERPPSIETVAARLVVLDVESDFQFPLTCTGDVTIGRIDPHRGIRPDIDLSTYDPAARISRRHARISVRGSQFFVEDLGSANGTAVNGSKKLKPMEPFPLANGDVIKIGDTTLKFIA